MKVLAKVSKGQRVVNRKGDVQKFDVSPTLLGIVIENGKEYDKFIRAVSKGDQKPAVLETLPVTKEFVAQLEKAAKENQYLTENKVEVSFAVMA